MPSAENIVISSETATGSRDFSSFRELAESLSKAGVAAIGSSYIVGLLIINLHLRRYGINYVGFLRIEYVMAGLVWIFLVAMVYLAGGRGVALVKSFGKAIKSHQFFDVFVNMCVLFGLVWAPLLALNLLTENTHYFYNSDMWKALGIIALNAMGVYNVLSLLQSLSKWKEMMTSQKWHNGFYVMYFLLMFVGPLILYANIVYPKISPAFCGGKRQSVMFVIKGEQVDAARTAGLPLPDNRKVESEIIFEAPDFFLITPPPGLPETPKVKAVRLRKDLIDAILYFDRISN